MEKRILRLAGIVKESIVDGFGFRLALFAQGCPHKCKGCHNPETHPYDGGTEYTVTQILDMAKANPLLDGLTLSGGEPFCQARVFGELAKEARDRGLSIWTYTGYTWEELTIGPNIPSAKEAVALGCPEDVAILLNNTDVLIDGKFMEDKKDYRLRFRGSSNQRLINVKASFISGAAVEIEE